MTGDERELWSVVEGMFAAFTDGRTHDIDSALADECTVWDVFEPTLIRSRAERDAFHVRDQAQARARGPLSLRLEPLLISRFDDFGIVRYHVHFEYAQPNATAGHVRVTDVLRRCGKRWQIVHHHEGMRPAGPPPYTLAPQ
ncbi:MAG: DUF4440 domain-containing protein [Steroidobacteraceae bacterium]